MAVSIGIAEDCAGLGTLTLAAHRHVRESDDLKNLVELKHLYCSEVNDELREILMNKYVCLGCNSKGCPREVGHWIMGC